MAAGRFVVPPYFPARDRDFNLLSGALLYVYQNETTTKTNIYTDEALTVLSSNPVVANSSGQFPAIYAEAGTEASPVLYSVSITTSTGASPGNPFNFDNYRPSVDWETAALALADAAAAAAEASADDAAASADEAEAAAVLTAADLAAIEAIAAGSPSAPSIINKADRDGSNLTGTQPAEFLAVLDGVSLTALAASSGSDLVGFQPSGTGAVSRTAQEKLRDFVNVKDFGAVGDGVADDTQAFRDAISFAHGRAVYVPGGDYLITSQIRVEPVAEIDRNPAKAVGAFAPGMWLFGDGMVETRIQCRVPNNSMFYCNVTNPVPYAYRAQMGMRVQNLAIVGAGSVANSSAFEILNAYQIQFSQVHIRSLTGSAIRMVNGEFLDDGWNCALFDSVWIEACGTGGFGFGFDATGATGRNEGSFTQLRNVFIQGCGRNEYFSLTDLSDVAGEATLTLNLNQMPQTSPTATAHPFVPERVMGTNPISTVNGSARVTIAVPGTSNYIAGQQINITGAGAVGGITLSGDYVIQQANPTNIIVTHGSAATSTANGGGTGVTINARIKLKMFGVLKSQTLALNPISTVINTPIVTIASTGHGLSVGDVVTFSGATATGGITVSGSYPISSVVTNSFTIISPTVATSSATGGGGSVVMVSPMWQANDTVYTVGPSPTSTTLRLYTDDTVPVPVSAATWGTWVSGLPAPVPLGADPFATVNGSATVTVTHTAHGAASADLVTFAGAAPVGGVTVNGQYRIGVVIDANTYTITATTATSTVAAGGGGSVTAQYTLASDAIGEVAYYEPRSGGMSSKGQLVKLQSCGFTVNQNVAQYVPGGAGNSIGLLCEQVTWENNYRRHLFIRGGINYLFQGCQFHGNKDKGLSQWRLADFDASEFVVTQVLWQNTKVRAKECPAIAFKYSGKNGNPNTVRVRGTFWDDFDYVGQNRFVGVQFDQVQQNMNLSWFSATLMTLRPIQSFGEGAKTPLRLRGPQNGSGTGVASMTGEWISAQATSNNGVSAFNTTTGMSGGPALANNTIYNMYLYDNDGVLALTPSLVAPTIDATNGYMVMAGDPTMLWVGRAQTDGSAQWLSTGAQFLNPVIIPGGQEGQDASLWFSDADRKLYIKSTPGLPTVLTGGTYAYVPTFETSVAYDPPSLAAGASTTTTVAVTCGVGDFCSGVGFSLGWGGLTATGCVSAANTVTVTITNNTAGTIDLASGNLRVNVQRR